jgi:hypothetical protein
MVKADAVQRAPVAHKSFVVYILTSRFSDMEDPATPFLQTARPSKGSPLKLEAKS